MSNDGANRAAAKKHRFRSPYDRRLPFTAWFAASDELCTRLTPTPFSTAICRAGRG